MSYDIDLCLNDSLVEVVLHAEGGTYPFGGTNGAHLNITYNYSKFYYDFIDKKKGIRWLYGKEAKDTIECLENAIAKLGTARDEDYWKPTAGNAGYVLSILLRWAKANPEAVWSGD